jgi:hypothetical protein
MPPLTRLPEPVYLLSITIRVKTLTSNPEDGKSDDSLFLRYSRTGLEDPVEYRTLNPDIVAAIMPPFSFHNSFLKKQERTDTKKVNSLYCML